uniref:Trafficking protein particle complex subunit n=1 Tax=Trieres chinensis TaxID=1514140 RepID=A0A7S2EIS9_TRICV|mmetsp:Transcript_25660/g.52549  ORF Transcript_25660/g.52549 Transcript_25660/m.52549 type:complete len:222 (+) Transcript_25660:112-777(+)|eukprot:CAMPEP_0183306030 /NCGR_PEP_ID=MMETSP0160_2-20130417/10581_1 /TAXON_ID=2839 ORGANISM="Odontella Sinensis, Strain Grunow 1884" /NCGR_SAMPLE_ID=MMETSP0160_2 /ASSEMBLY_ACC=CAM_ASM_000250 /LENGTH=221 /DNA_ID=CAMNT_0025469331 /DNA_START=70 /DNA_END=735 /DNA_ORIENTATION=-
MAFPDGSDNNAMSLLSIALVSRNGDPMYSREFRGSRDSRAGYDKDETSGSFGKESLDEDFFGLGQPVNTTTSEAFPPSMNGSRCSLRQQFILHAAIDRFDELTAPMGWGCRWRPTGAVGTDAMWVGLLCPIEELRVYGYITTTRVRILATVEDGFPPDQAPQQKKREVELKNLLASVHALYVEYMMNPFTETGTSNIESRRFDEGVKNLVDAYNGTRTVMS